jgi:hypothetical protein
MSFESVVLQKKTRCTTCRTVLLDGTVVRVIRNSKGKIKEYLCKDHEGQTPTNDNLTIE